MQLGTNWLKQNKLHKSFSYTKALASDTVLNIFPSLLTQEVTFVALS